MWWELSYFFDSLKRLGLTFKGESCWYPYFATKVSGSPLLSDAVHFQPGSSDIGMLNTSVCSALALLEFHTRQVNNTRLLENGGAPCLNLRRRLAGHISAMVRASVQACHCVPFVVCFVVCCWRTLDTSHLV